jgi:Fe2+ transport system protein FeoA
LQRELRGPRIASENESQLHRCLELPPSVHDLIPLSVLAAGAHGEVGAVLGSPEQVHRLEEMGLRGGTCVEMLQPGSPCIIRLGGQKLCFRADDLVSVLVRPGNGA